MSENSVLRKIYYSRYYLLFGVIVLFFSAAAFTKAYYQNYQIRQEINKLQEETEKIQAKNFELSKYLKYTESDTFVEEKARTELNMAKEGENIFVITGGAEDFSRQIKNEMVQSDSASNVHKWWKYFFQK